MKVSICIPTYNNPDCVQKLLESIEAQTFRDFEIILTDDSTDERISRLVGKFTQLPIRYFHNEKPLGHIFNWNEAIRLAAGDYIKIMFSDDWFTGPDSLAKFAALLDENPQASLAFSGSMQVSEKSSYARCASDLFFTEIEKNWHYLFGGNEFGAPSAVIYRNNGALFEERSNWASDMFLYFDVLAKGGQAVGTREPLVSIGVHDEQYTCSFTRTDPRKYQDYVLLYEKYGLSADKLCRRQFLDCYLMQYKRQWKEAKRLGFSFLEYLRAWLPFVWKQQICCGVRALGRKVRKAYGKADIVG